LKPLNVPDLLATVAGKLHRFRGVLPSAQTAPKVQAVACPAPPAPLCRQIGKLRINLPQHHVWLGEEPVILSAREFSLLRRLSDEVGSVMSPQELIKATHAFDVDSQEAGGLIRPLIRSLRHRLGDANYIENVRGVGYRLLTPT
jgi:DNA-binding response OmpR family regulator